MKTHILYSLTLIFFSSYVSAKEECETKYSLELKESIELTIVVDENNLLLPKNASSVLNRNYIFPHYDMIFHLPNRNMSVKFNGNTITLIDLETQKLKKKKINHRILDAIQIDESNFVLSLDGRSDPPGPGERHSILKKFNLKNLSLETLFEIQESASRSPVMVDNEFYLFKTNAFSGQVPSFHFFDLKFNHLKSIAPETRYYGGAPAVTSSYIALPVLETRSQLHLLNKNMEVEKRVSLPGRSGAINIEAIDDKNLLIYATHFNERGTTLGNRLIFYNTDSNTTNFHDFEYLKLSAQFVHSKTVLANMGYEIFLFDKKGEILLQEEIDEKDQININKNFRTKRIDGHFFIAYEYHKKSKNRALIYEIKREKTCLSPFL